MTSLHSFVLALAGTLLLMPQTSAQSCSMQTETGSCTTSSCSAGKSARAADTKTARRGKARIYTRGKAQKRSSVSRSVLVRPGESENTCEPGSDTCEPSNTTCEPGSGTCEPSNGLSADNSLYLTEARPGEKAQYFVYLTSASWCPYCVQSMPTAVKMHQQMRADGGKVELILVSADSSEEQAVQFLKKNGATFPAIMDGNSDKLPGYEYPVGIPSVRIVDARGKLVASGGSSLLSLYKDTILAYETRNGITSSSGGGSGCTTGGSCSNSSDSSASAVETALDSLDFFNSAYLNKEADYYLLYYGSPGCGICQYHLPELVNLYSEMVGSGRVELIFVSCNGFTKQETTSFLAQQGGIFPAVLSSDSALRKLPRMDGSFRFPGVIIFERNGTEIIKGDGLDILPEWRSYTIER